MKAQVGFQGDLHAFLKHLQESPDYEVRPSRSLPRAERGGARYQSPGHHFQITVAQEAEALPMDVLATKIHRWIAATRKGALGKA